MLFDAALPAAELEACYESARVGRLLHEHPRLLATWHPLIADRAAGVCVAMTSDGPWAARPRSESLSVVEMVRAYAPRAPRQLVVVFVPEKDCHHFDPKRHAGLADYVILTDAAIRRSHDYFDARGG